MAERFANCASHTFELGQATAMIIPEPCVANERANGWERGVAVRWGLGLNEERIYPTIFWSGS